ncbi:MAG: Tex family protein, partial [Bacteroidales bacterium]
KEMTGTMNEEVIVAVQKRFQQLLLLEKRREAVIESINEQEKMTPELLASLQDASTMQDLEDLYLPYKPKRRTKATIAREKGLEPLADLILQQRIPDLITKARQFVDSSKGVLDVETALEGARDIIAEWVSENKTGRDRIRNLYHRTSAITSEVLKGKEQEGHTYQQYFEWNESLAHAPSHRVLALFRGETEGILKVKLTVDKEQAQTALEKIFVKTSGETANQIKLAVNDSWKRLLEPSIENEIRAHYKAKADEVSIKVFAENLRQLLLAPPLGQKRVLAIDPGFRTGCKVIVMNELGKLLHNETIFPHPPAHEVKQAIQKLRTLVNSYKIEVIAIGNGTAGRETEDLVRGIPFDRDVTAIMVNESGASVYSASQVARDEFPDYDITVRGAVSIGRRLMDPLAELVKIDPKSIGVGQYQHDVDQKALQESLESTVELCVNAVGVDLNTASKQLLSYVSGVGPQLASNIISKREELGGFSSRQQLKKVPRLGDKVFEQCAGFLKIRQSSNPLDASAVHPESYHIVEKIAKSLNKDVGDLIGNKELLKTVDIRQYIDKQTGIETLTDILAELEKPGRDPRSKFEFFEFAKDIRDIDDLRDGMILNGIVTNITAFGAFVDIGVHQDGLVHLSQMADRFIRDPNEVVKLNQKVRVQVVSVDAQRKRIGLTMKMKVENN